MYNFLSPRSYGQEKSGNIILRTVGKSQKILMKLEESQENIRTFYHSCK